jgi:hypothetical protein
VVAETAVAEEGTRGTAEGAQMRIRYEEKTTAEIMRFCEEYVALCRRHGIRLGANQGYALEPVVEGLCRSGPWSDVLRQTARIGELP